MTNFFFFYNLLGASLIRPWGFIQSYCCGIKRKSQNKFNETLPILPLIDSSLPGKSATEEISIEELNEKFKSLEILLREYVIDIKYLQKIKNSNIDNNKHFN